MEQEIWKDIPGYEGFYQASSLGRIKSLRVIRKISRGFRTYPEKILRRSERKGVGHHLSIALIGLNGKSICCRVHQLILLTFVGPCPIGMECRHYPDPDPTNNRVENLSWGTRKQNFEDRKEQGAYLFGETGSSAKLTEAQVIRIRELRKRGVSPAILADMFCVSKGCIGGITLGKNWKHLL